MTSLLDKIKAKKAQQEQQSTQALTPAADFIKTLLKKHNAEQTAMQKLLKVFPEAKPVEANPFNRLAMFVNDAPTDPTKVASTMVAAFGHTVAYDKVLELMDACTAEGDAEAAGSWHLVEDIIGQIIEQRNAQDKQARIETKAMDELAPEPFDEDYLEEPQEGVQESFSLNVDLNERQLAARDMAFSGKSFCYIGPAGSGKTTGTRAIGRSLHESGKLGVSNFKSMGGERYDAPSIAFVAYTRRATGNLRKAIHKDSLLASVFAGNVMTIHQLLEFSPVYYMDPLTGQQRFRFEPKRNAEVPLNLTHIVIEEASMVGAHDLWMQLYDALPVGVQIIFIGDINQLPPVFGPSILNYALIQLPIIELVETYRNQGAVLDNAHRILRGEPIEETKLCNVIRGNKPIQLGQETMGNRIIPHLFKHMYDTLDEKHNRIYDPEHDMIISPFNKQAMGTININRWIAQDLGDRRGAIVHEIIAGFNKLYLAEGDKVMVNKRDGAIIKIERNPSYVGKEPQLPGKDLSRFGIRIMDRSADFDLDDLDAAGFDYSNFSLEEIENQEAERKQQASHTVRVRYEDGTEEDLNGAGDFSEATFSLGYIITGHKAQGSEWRKVFALMHKDHSTMLFREWFYTIYTRARIGVTLITKDYLIEKAIKTPRIIGNSLKAKLAFFNSGINVVDVPCSK